MIHKRAQFATLAVATAVTLGVVVGTGQTANGAQSTAQHRSAPKGIPACQWEDGHTQRLCYWDGTKRGNHKGWSFVSHAYGRYVTYMINAPQSCQALANVGSWKSYGEDGVSVWNGRELAGMMIDDARTFKWGTKGLDRACTAWLDEFARDHLKILNKR